jgi:hypothetical protein
VRGGLNIARLHVGRIVCLLAVDDASDYAIAQRNCRARAAVQLLRDFVDSHFLSPVYCNSLKVLDSDFVVVCVNDATQMTFYALYVTQIENRTESSMILTGLSPTANDASEVSILPRVGALNFRFQFFRFLQRITEARNVPSTTLPSASAENRIFHRCSPFVSVGYAE